MIHYELISNRHTDTRCTMPDALRFAQNGAETRVWNVRNHYFNGTFSEIRFRHIDLMRHRVACTADCCLETTHDDTSFLAFGAVLDGKVFCNQNRDQRVWTQGDANLMAACGYRKEYNRFARGGTFDMFDVVVSPTLFQMADRYPALWEAAYRRMERGESFFFSADNLPLTPALLKGIREASDCNLMGNCAEMYAEAKTMECMALFLRAQEEKPAAPSALSRSLCDKMRHAKAILEREFVHPPTLAGLARETGTNECALKAAFKQMFHCTVFGYLFEVRMNWAALYLTETDYTIADIAQRVGYDYPGHFSTAFKRKFTVSPAQYRGKTRKGECPEPVFQNKYTNFVGD